MKKGSSKAAANVAHFWHPDFRVQDSLPDIKAVRTSFFTSALFLTLALMAVMYIGFREYTTRQLADNMSTLEAENFSHKAKNNMALNKNKQFREKANSILQVETFFEKQMLGSDLLLGVSSKVPEKMALTSLSYQNNHIKVSGEIVGERATVTETIDDFILSLKESGADQGQFSEYDLVSLRGAKDGSSMQFEIVISNPAEKKDKK